MEIKLGSLQDVLQLSESLARARGFVPKHLLGDAPSIAAAILTGLELGIGPMEALRSIHVIDGRPTLSADLMLARAIRAGIRVSWSRTDAQCATIVLERSGVRHEHTFSWQDAERAGLTRRQSWQQYPAAMLRARCVAAALRAFAPDVLGAGIYEHDELADGDSAQALPPPSKALLEATVGPLQVPAAQALPAPSSSSTAGPAASTGGHAEGVERKADGSSDEGAGARTKERVVYDDEPPPPEVEMHVPTRLRDCLDADQVLAWCRRNRDKLRRNPDRAREELRRACERTGADPEEVSYAADIDFFPY